MGDSNATPIALNVPTTINAFGTSTNVANLGADNRQLIYIGASANDVVEVWGSLNDVDYAKTTVELSGSQDEAVFTDRSLYYKLRKVAGSTSASSCSITGPDVGSAASAQSSAFKVRNMGPSSNVASLSSFTVASNDGITNVAGDVVCLYAQTNPIQNGPYVVGAVAAGAAPLTRPSWWPAGGSIQAGQRLEIAAGTLFIGTSWKSMAPASFQVDSADPTLYPEFVAQQATLVARTVTLTNVPIKSATKSQIHIKRTTANTTSSTVQYSPSAITPGALGTASLTVQAQVAAGTISASDVSTLNIAIQNF